MQRQSREIEIFSTSALDLFASALGAFMLLAVILMPFFPNVGDSEERVAEMKAAREAAQAAAEEAQAKAQELRETLAKLQRSSKIAPIDIVIALDTTGSMALQVEGLKQDVTALGEILMGITDSAALSVVDFKDACEGARALRVRDLMVVDSASISNMREFLRPMFAGNYPPDCNTDDPEAVDLALAAGIAQNWRPEARRVIVIATDNPARPGRVADTLSDAAGFAAAGGKVSTVFVQTDRTGSGTADYLRRLASTGNGQFVAQGGSFIGAVLVAAFE